MLTASWEPAWCEGGLGDPCVHVRLDAAEEREDLEAWVGEVRAVGDGRGLLRLRPELDLPTFGLLLRRAGLEVSELVPGTALRASRGPER